MRVVAGRAEANAGSDRPESEVDETDASARHDHSDEDEPGDPQELGFRQMNWRGKRSYLFSGWRLVVLGMLCSWGLSFWLGVNYGESQVSSAWQAQKEATSKFVDSIAQLERVGIISPVKNGATSAQLERAVLANREARLACEDSTAKLTDLLGLKRDDPSIPRCPIKHG